MGPRYQVIISKLADKDIDRIVLRLNNKFGERTAGETYDAIINKIASLETMPEAHPPYTPNNPGDKNLYRWVAAKKIHRIIYTFQEEGGVYVVRVRHIKELSWNVANALVEEE